MLVKVKKLHENAVVPGYATVGAGCFDLVATEVDNWSEHNVWICRTGLAFEIPHGHVMLIYSRSGHGFKHDVRLANCVGVIDADYRGEVMVKLRCDTQNNPLFVDAGHRVAQAMIVPVPNIEFMEVSALSTTTRGAGGFGSTGSK